MLFQKRWVIIFPLTKLLGFNFNEEILPGFILPPVHSFLKHAYA